MNKIGIIGGGNGGVALHADLMLSNNITSMLYYDKNYVQTIKPALQHNCIKLYKDNLLYGTIEDKNITSNLEELVANCDIIFNTTPINAHVEVAKRFFSIVESSQITRPIHFINLGGGFSPYFQERYLGENLNINLGSTSSLPYACRVIENNCYIYGSKTFLDIAFLDNVPTKIKEQLAQLGITEFIHNESVLEVGFKNVNPINHPIISLFNLGLIEREEEFLFYKDGITQSISNFLHQIDKERVAIAKAFGYTVLPDLEQDNLHYHTNFKSYYDYSQRTQTHANITAPKTINHRYFTEDIPYGLVPLASLASFHNLKISGIDSVINIYNLLTNQKGTQGGYKFTNLIRLRKDVEITQAIHSSTGF